MPAFPFIRSYLAQTLISARTRSRGSKAFAGRQIGNRRFAMSRPAQWAAPFAFLLCLGATASADVITDWNEKAIALVAKHRVLPPQAERIIACMHVAMFDAVNSVDRRYLPYGALIPAPKHTSKEAAAATAAHGVLAQLFPKDGDELRGALASYLAPIAEGPAKSEGLKLGEAAATQAVMDRQGDGAEAPDAYRPK